MHTDPACRLAQAFSGWHICTGPAGALLAEGESCALDAHLDVNADLLAGAIMDDPFVGPKGVR